MSLIMPVREITENERGFLASYVTGLESKGKKVYLPPRDTDQVDSIGYRICSDNLSAIRRAKEVHVYWTAKSQGSRFDLGMAFASNKPIKLINFVESTPKKSFENVLIALDKLYNSL